MTPDPYELRKFYYSDDNSRRRSDYLNPNNEGKYFVQEFNPDICLDLNSNFTLSQFGVLEGPEIEWKSRRFKSEGRIPITLDEFYSLLKEHSFFVFDFTDDMFVYERLNPDFSINTDYGTSEYGEEALVARELALRIGDIELNFPTYRKLSGQLDKKRLVKAERDPGLHRKLDMRYARIMEENSNAYKLEMATKEAEALKKKEREIQAYNISIANALKASMARMEEDARKEERRLERKREEMREEEAKLKKKREEILQKRLEVANEEFEELKHEESRFQSLLASVKGLKNKAVSKVTPPEVQELIKEDPFLLKWHAIHSLRVRRKQNKRIYTNLMLSKNDTTNSSTGRGNSNRFSRLPINPY